MSLRDHLLELRRRLLRSAIAIVLGAVAGWFLYDPLFTALTQPITEIQQRRGAGSASINFAGVVDPFNLKLKLAFLLGILVSSPVWLYQFWAFITPGLTRHERRYSLAFIAAAVPLFLGGSFLAWTVLPKAVEFLNAFIPNGGSSIIEVNAYVAFASRIILAFGVAFVCPVVLVGLNMAGLMPARVMAKHWRIGVFLVFLFAAVATPSPEATSMLVLAGAMLALFLVAYLICRWLDRRRAKRRTEPDYDVLADDEASPLA